MPYAVPHLCGTCSIANEADLASQPRWRESEVSESSAPVRGPCVVQVSVLALDILAEAAVPQWCQITKFHFHIQNSIG